MKKIFSIFLAFLIFTGCSSSGSYDTTESVTETTYATTDSAASESMEYSKNEEQSPQNFEEKIAYTIHTHMETKIFDDAISKINSTLEKYGGFIEFSSLYGDTHRYADYTLRVPTEYYKTFLDDISSSGNIYSIETIAENLTNQFIDTEARLNSLKVEEERLLEILKSATEIADVITLEQRLSSVRYEIESYQTTLNAISLKVDYSTIHLSVSEVVEFENTENFFDRVSATFKNSYRDLLRNFENLTLSAIYYAPFWIVFALILFVFYKLLKKPVKKLILKIKNAFKKDL